MYDILRFPGFPYIFKWFDKKGSTSANNSRAIRKSYYHIFEVTPLNANLLDDKRLTTATTRFRTFTPYVLLRFFISTERNSLLFYPRLKLHLTTTATTSQLFLFSSNA